MEDVKPEGVADSQPPPATQPAAAAPESMEIAIRQVRITWQAHPL